MAVVLPLGIAAAVLPAQAAEPTTFTLVQVPDTQQEALEVSNKLATSRNEWLRDNKDALNIRFVVRTGDVVGWGVADPAQFARADAATKILDSAGLPYAQAIGNHDTAAVAVGGSAAPGNVRDNLRNTTDFNKTFPVSRFKNVGGTYEPGKADNMYQTFSAGGKDWLVLTLEMWPRQGAIDWGKKVVAAHPTYNVIINTHANIDKDGLRPTTGIYGDKDSQYLWQQLGSQYPNIRMILSGHYATMNDPDGAFYNEVQGTYGNKVLQVMTTYHYGDQNPTRLLKIDTAQMTVTSSVYVAYATNPKLKTGYITDRASNFTATNMNFVGPAKTVPDPPTGVTANAGDRSATVSFAAPASTGGDAITQYTVTSSPGGLKATGGQSPITVSGLTNGTKYTFTVTATNGVGTGGASAASAAVTPSAAATQLLPDPGFETGMGGWTAFKVGTMTRVTSPVRSGSYALKVQSPESGYVLTGLTQNTAVSKSVSGKTYTARCYVRPSTSGLEVRIRLLQYAQDFSSNTNLNTNIVSTLPANTWTEVTVSGTADKSEMRIIPQIYASFQTKNTGYLVYDDCSLS